MHRSLATLLLIFTMSYSLVARAACAQELAPQIQLGFNIDPVTGQIRAILRKALAPAKAPTTLEEHYRFLMRQYALLKQNDPRLDDRGLLLPDGGLCASTCAVNVVHAMINSLGQDRESYRANADLYVAEMLAYIEEMRAVDGRRGLNFGDLTLGLHFLAQKFRLRLDVQALTPTANRGLTVADLRTRADEILLLSVHSGTNEKGQDTFHALVVSDSRVDHGSLSYSDPNSPEVARQVQVHRALENGGLQSVRVPYAVATGEETSTGVINDALRIRLVPQ